MQEVYELVGTVRYHYFQTTFRLLADTELHMDHFKDRSLKKYNSTTHMLEPIMMPNGLQADTPWPIAGGSPATDAATVPDDITLMPYSSVSWGLDFS